MDTLFVFVQKTHNFTNEPKEILRTNYNYRGGAMTMQEKIDKALGKWASRKLIVWGTATVFLAVGSLTSSDWVAVSLAYIGLQGAADIAATWKHGK
jgi:rRNA maturation protein Rpf1